MLKNSHLASCEAFEVQLKNGGASELFGDVPLKKAFFCAEHSSPNLMKNVYRLAGPN